jgi:antitoxin YefM
MDAITYTHARTHLAKMMEKVCDDHDPVIITRQNQRSVVNDLPRGLSGSRRNRVSLTQPKNARRLLESIAELESSGGTERELVE